MDSISVAPLWRINLFLSSALIVVQIVYNFIPLYLVHSCSKCLILFEQRCTVHYLNTSANHCNVFKNFLPLFLSKSQWHLEDASKDKYALSISIK